MTEAPHAHAPVLVRRESVVLPTHEPAAPDPNPMFLEKRVYQGSNGCVYPLPFTDRVAERAAPRAWDAVYLENNYVRVMLLPGLGGRLHAATDLTNGYELFYRQEVIKPALVGLAGPWASGGVEFNWPQHHRPSTAMPAEVAVERHDDGSATVWLSEHDPLCRMKGMHGLRLRPGSSVIELRVRVHNRTPFPQTFLWWTNMAARVHEAYQSFFPPDVRYVADHAKRATSRFPRCSGRYYGVDYGSRARHGVPEAERPARFVPPHCGGEAPGAPRYSPDDLSWYANIPVPTSYMAMGSRQDFFGGYDHAARAGVLHLADHNIVPGKKQWTWGNHDFGYAWDRNLTAPGADGVHAPYIELMAGAYTDNQPDFSFLQPGETRSWSQWWYPLREIGPACHANLHAALSLSLDQGRLRLGLHCPGPLRGARVTLRRAGRVLWTCATDLGPDKPLLHTQDLPRATRPDSLQVELRDADGVLLLSHSPQPEREATADELTRAAATEPPAPDKIASQDELFLTGLHLHQYRHATRCPTLYWAEALRRDPGDSRCLTALGKWHLQRGEFDLAERRLRDAVDRLTRRNPNPADGEAHYHLGLTLRLRAFAGLTVAPARARADLDEAAACFAKAAWNQAWAAAAHHALAELASLDDKLHEAVRHCRQSLSLDGENLRARNLLTLLLRRLGDTAGASELLAQSLALDPLDAWARLLHKPDTDLDNQLRLDLAHDFLRAGLFEEALGLLAGARPGAQNSSPWDRGTAPLLAYAAAWACALAAALGRPAETTGPVGRQGWRRASSAWLARAAGRPADYCFPARLEELPLLQWACRTGRPRALPQLLLGLWLQHRRRHREAASHHRAAVRLDPSCAAAWRCLGILAANTLDKPALARRCYERAFTAAPRDARLLYERDQLWKRQGVPVSRRLAALLRRRDLVCSRDDLVVELCALHNQAGEPGKALALLRSRRFQPWEGGEGQVLAQHVRAHLLLGREALRRRRPDEARTHFAQALQVPEQLGEARHPLANPADIHFWLGEAEQAAGERERARGHWEKAASMHADFRDMQVCPYSETSYFTALALRRLGRARRADALLRGLLAHARALARRPARIDYFATSLPTMLLFNADLQAAQDTQALLLEALALLGLGRQKRASLLLARVLERDPGQALAADLLAR